MGLIASTTMAGLGTALYRRSDPDHVSRSYSLGTQRAIGRRMPPSGVLTYPEITAHLIRYQPNDATRALYTDSVPGYLLVDWKCTHLGCRVPPCESSAWFECLCHGVRYNQIGEYKFGPAVRGFDRYATRLIVGDELVADTRFRIPGPPRGTNTIDNPPSGPHCVG